MKTTSSWFTVLILCYVATLAPAADWVHWRGPEQSGFAKGQKLPESFELKEAGKNGLVWKQPYGGRSTPLILKGRIYTISGYDSNKPTEGERVLCLDEKTGTKIWENRFNVFHTDIVSSRLGWTNLTADPENERIYAHTTSGSLFCFDKEGKLVWKHELTEEYGRVSGYGGRIVSPIFDSGLCIMPMLQASWGDYARGGNRFVAFDGATGKVVWWADTTLAVKSTYTSSPVIAVINGQRMLVAGGGDGALHALNVRTGKIAWSYPVANGAVNPTPIVDGNLVYIAHGEPNIGGGSEGLVICLDASQIDPTTKRPKKVWEYRKSNRFGLASIGFAEGRLYVPDDGAELFCFNGKTGKLLWKKKYGTVSRGAPLICDGKLYIFDVFGKFSIMTLDGDKEPEDVLEISLKSKIPGTQLETHGTPAAVNGRLYFLTRDELFCVGAAEPVTETSAYKPLAAEKPFEPTAAPAAIRLFPADVVAKPGETLKFDVKYMDANGRDVKAPDGATVEWSVFTPPVPMGATTGPPPLNAELKPTGEVVLAKLPNQQGIVLAKVGTMVARARVRVAPQLPYAQDFEKLPVGGAPGGWVNTNGKFTVKDLKGNKVLAKVNTNPSPLVARANGYITTPEASNYTIEADVYGTVVKDKLPDVGVVNSRYTLILDGKKDPNIGKLTARIVTWEAMPRLNKVIPYEWKPETWYRLKLSVDSKGDKGLVRAKVWEKGQPEPAEWMITMEDPSPNKQGAAALYGYIANIESTTVAGSEAYYDNVTIKPNDKK